MQKLVSYQESRSRFKFSKSYQLLGKFGNDVIVQNSDGIGRKTKNPCVLQKMNVSQPERGYYFVIHFNRDGTVCPNYHWMQNCLERWLSNSINQELEKNGFARRVK